MTDRIEAAFSRCRRAGRSALVPYFTSGHPEGAKPWEIMAALVEAGADLIELGVPFSDPLADGPVIQASSFSALKAGASMSSTLFALREFRAADRRTPVVLFTYLNPVLAYGPRRFVSDSSRCGADGVLITDLPFGADSRLEALIDASPLRLVRLIAPTTRPERTREIGRGSSGFVYYISRTGVTGGDAALRDALAEEASSVCRAVALPVVVGFGVATAAQAARVAGLADGVVVGSALVRRLQTGGVEGGAAFVRELAEAVRSGSRA